jgi:hypothetical protein
MKKEINTFINSVQHYCEQGSILKKHEIVFAICGLVIERCKRELARTQLVNSALYKGIKDGSISFKCDPGYTAAKQQLLRSRLYKRVLAELKEPKENHAELAPMEYYTNPQPTAFGEHHVSLGRGNKSRIDDESFVDAAYVSLGMGTKNLPSAQYSH